jgi:hypothetical protein
MKLIKLSIQPSFKLIELIFLSPFYFLDQGRTDVLRKQRLSSAFEDKDDSKLKNKKPKPRLRFSKKVSSGTS